MDREREFDRYDAWRQTVEWPARSDAWMVRAQIAFDESAELRERIAALEGEVEKAKQEAWSAESWFLRMMKRSGDPLTRSIAEHYPAGSPAPWLAEVERLRGMLDYLAPVDKNGKMHLRDGRGDLSVMDTWLWRRVQNATLRGGKE